MEYRYGSHTVFNLEYHFVWVTKYRYKVLTGEIALRARELVRQTCEAFEMQIIKGVVSPDHVHIFVSAPPTLAPSEICVESRVGPQASYLRIFRTCESGFWADIFGHGVIFVHRQVK